MAVKYPQIPFFFRELASYKAPVMVSACLLGEPVRYDGETKYLSKVELLREHLSLMACCPEVAAGLGTPRPPVQLVQTSDKIIVRGRDNDTLDVTEALVQFAETSVRHCDRQLCGYLFKSRSPSCGLGSTPLFNTAGEHIDSGNGIQAKTFLTHKPWLAFRQETDLNSEQDCLNFILECQMVAEGLHCPPKNQQALIDHYQSHKMTVTQLKKLQLLFEKS
jgi:uncharacterized protein YbbK (DUF523 family)